MPAIVEEVVADDGHRFQLRRFAPTGDVARRGGVLWLPALGVPAQKYDALATELAALGFEVALHEWRGLATSSLRASRRVDWGYRELLGQDLAATLRLLPAGPWVFGGHSLGAQFATMLAARNPGRCAGLALVAGGVPYPATLDRRYGLALAPLVRLMPLLVRTLGHFPGKHLKFAGREAAGVMCDWAASARSGRYADYGDGVAMESLLARTDVPALGLVMRDDWMAPPASLAMLLGKLGGDRRQTAVLDPETLGVAADHFRWLRQPRAVAAKIAAWAPLSS
jgi:predicted alpha/beta hydrolase